MDAARGIWESESVSRESESVSRESESVSRIWFRDMGVRVCLRVRRAWIWESRVLVCLHWQAARLGPCAWVALGTPLPAQQSARPRSESLRAAPRRGEPRPGLHGEGADDSARPAPWTRVVCASLAPAAVAAPGESTARLPRATPAMPGGPTRPAAAARPARFARCPYDGPYRAPPATKADGKSSWEDGLVTR